MLLLFFSHHRGLNVVHYSHDKDMLQLVEPGVHVSDFSFFCDCCFIQYVLRAIIQACLQKSLFGACVNLCVLVFIVFLSFSCTM